ncbi:thiamine pyrophosphate-dependent enzyme [Nocardioides nitrophenolicus]|uniref:thiamine pyrophosphate-dependent enzyme n=1 Tax=Nocardioides nitrophenolicus TaxID=60489 RepID=UPI00195C30C6|nr:thiamine pyrophosphate-dependent enzyme [Nocardioides nitrophenolicus]MBM7517007.1 thiamine pyrophosphate-dependent acetolactate synthase large subunit-like protein [Nocardioides nitrophenolicus]
MKRADVAAAVAAAAPDHVVVASLGSAGRAWREHGGPNPTFYASDPMGAAPGLALGAALARPDLGLLLLEGDGDLVMNLGSLLAIADAAPANLRVVVFNNGRYETGGGQPLAAGALADLAAIARGAGWPFARTVARDTDPAELRGVIDELLTATGPGVVVVEVDTEPSPYGGPGEVSGAEAQQQFRTALANWERSKGGEG